MIALFERAAETLRSQPCRMGSVDRIPAVGRLLVTGDLHDNPFHLQKITHLARLGASKDHHVVLHEMIHGEKLVNGADMSHRMLAKVAELVLQHPGQVHPLLANHELAQMTGRGVSKGAGNSVDLFNDGLEYVFGDDWGDVSAAMVEFIKAFALALITDSGILCAHSLPAPHMIDKFDFEVINRELTPQDYVPPTGAAHLMVWGRQHQPEEVERLAAAWKIKLFCLGHEHADTGLEMRGPRLLILNSDHEHASVLPIDLAEPVPAAEEALMYGIPLAAVAAPRT